MKLADNIWMRPHGQSGELSVRHHRNSDISLMSLCRKLAFVQCSHTTCVMSQGDIWIYALDADLCAAQLLGGMSWCGTLTQSPSGVTPTLEVINSWPTESEVREGHFQACLPAYFSATIQHFLTKTQEYNILQCRHLYDDSIIKIWNPKWIAKIVTILRHSEKSMKKNELM